MSWMQAVQGGMKMMGSMGGNGGGGGQDPVSSIQQQYGGGPQFKTREDRNDTLSKDLHNPQRSKNPYK